MLIFPTFSRYIRRHGGLRAADSGAGSAARPPRAPPAVKVGRFKLDALNSLVCALLFVIFLKQINFEKKNMYFALTHPARYFSTPPRSLFLAFRFKF